jgi:glycosyltransferase involved in cell wall biosynthesis
VPSGDVEEVDGIPYHRIGGPDVPARWDDRLDANVEALLPIVERVRPAVIHAHSDFENPLLALAMRERFGIPVVNEVRGFWEETWLSGSPERRPTADRFRLRHQREVACARAADRVVTLATTMQRRLVGDGVDPSKISIIPNAVDPDRFPRVGRDPRLVRELGIQPDEIVIGYISSLVDYEGVDTLLEASAKLVAAGDPVRCLVVGDGKARERLEHMAAKLNLGRHVTFTGRVSPDEVLSYYGMIDIFVVPRRNDRVCRLVTPLKPFEAMSTGTALVMSGVEALQDIAEESRAAATFRPEDPDDLVATLRPLLNDRAARDRLGDQGHKWVREERTWAKNAARYREIYRDLGVL